MSGQKDPERDIDRRFVATVRSMAKRGTDHPMTEHALIGAVIGGVFGMAVLDNGLWLVSAIAGGAAAIYLKLDK